jgi:hypothetical protein
MRSEKRAKQGNQDTDLGAFQWKDRETEKEREQRKIIKSELQSKKFK